MRDLLQTERLTLRALSLSDAPLFSKYASNWNISRMTGSIPFPFPLLSAEIKITMMLSQKRRALACPYAITLNGGDLIGVMDLFRRHDDADYELGYWVASPYWGNGYAPEAAKALMDEAERSLKVRRFIAGVFADNPASMKVLTKLGFKNTGPEGQYFSMARLQHIESIGFERSVVTQSANCLQSQPAMRIEAH